MAQAHKSADSTLSVSESALRRLTKLLEHQSANVSSAAVQVARLHASCGRAAHRLACNAHLAFNAQQRGRCRRSRRWLSAQRRRLT